ncbi:3296_t:CDS:2, partial [Dentiscutata heterogama]
MVWEEEKGVYPPKNKLKYTQHPAKYPIPHNYVVRTMYSKKIYIVECLIVYIDDKPLYQIYFGEYLDKLRKHILGLGKRLLEFVEEEKENFFHPNDSIVLKQAKFEISGHTYNINYGKIDKQQIELQTQAIVKSIDHNRISQEAYRSLARLDETLIRAGA